MEEKTKIIPLQLDDGTKIRLEVTPIGEQRVGFQQKPFQEVTNVLKGIAGGIATSVKTIQEEVEAEKISIKFGVEIAAESGQLTGLIVKGAGKSSFEITIEW